MHTVKFPCSHTHTHTHTGTLSKFMVTSVVMIENSMVLPELSCYMYTHTHTHTHAHTHTECCVLTVLTVIFCASLIFLLVMDNKQLKQIVGT